MIRAVVCALLLCAPGLSGAKSPGALKFKQLDALLPSPSEMRLGSGAPGPAYWQQKVDYDIAVTLDDEARRLIGRETITYRNRSPHTLHYLWVQLDQNSFRPEADRRRVQSAANPTKFSYRKLRSLLTQEAFDGGVTIEAVTTTGGSALSHTIVGTMMRVDLPDPLEPDDSMRFKIAWSHAINDAKAMGGRGGYEHFPEDGHRIYTIAQWFPRMAAYHDVNGWQNKQFLGPGEFALEFGDYEVAITVPADHVVAATGVLTNPSQVLTSRQRKRLAAAQRADEPMFIVTPEEATENMKEAASGTRTWRFEAKNVRDFAFASSRRFIWDAMGVNSGDKRVLCMSFYPPQAEALWHRYSSPAIAHTIEVFGRMTFPYPYPVASSVNGPVGGMEYPMISFNGPRAEKDGTYTDKWSETQRWDRSKYGLISVVIHEVGHNWFPMIVNTDERQWTWMDEGMNSFIQFLAEREWEQNYPNLRGSPQKIVPYMTSPNQVPIMSNSESLLQFGNNAYRKPATALNILRETILGREVFDYAFKHYTTQWRFKRPSPADFFRSMEDAAGVDLDWFWRGWFFSTDRVDLSIANVELLTLDTRDPDVDKAAHKRERLEREKRTTQIRNEAEGLNYRVERFPRLKDFYNSYDADAVTEQDRERYQELLEDLEPWERELLKTKRYFYRIEFENLGGLVMPVPLQVRYEDGTQERIDYPAEIWRLQSDRVFKLLMTRKAIERLEIDPDRGLADCDHSNNVWPAEVTRSRFQLHKREVKPNPMQKEKQWREKKAKEAKTGPTDGRNEPGKDSFQQPSQPASKTKTSPASGSQEEQ